MSGGILKAVLVVLCLVFKANLSQQGCPLPEEIYPCQCGVKTDEMHLYCTHRSTELIMDVFKYMKNYTIDFAVIRSLRATKLASNFFGSNRVKLASFYAPKLTDVDENAFYRQNTMESIDFDDCGLTNLKSNVLKPLARLRSFRLSYSPDFKIVRNDSFSTLPNPEKLNFLHLRRDGISVIERNAFSHLNNLQILTLSGNELTSISSNALPTNLECIFILDLGKNSLRSLPTKLLAKVRTNLKLPLNGNKISAVSGEDIRLIYRKKLHVDLSGNRVHCGCSFGLVASYNSAGRAQYLNGTCFSPSSLRDVQFSRLTKELFKDCYRANFENQLDGIAGE